jgi:hypothetical protein
MRRTLLSAGLALVLATVAWAQAPTSNFSGTWVVDLVKSDFGPMPPPESVVLVVEHKEPNLKVTVTQKSAAGEVTNVRQVTTDGKDNPNKMRTPDGEQQEVISTTKWTGSALATSYKMNAQGMTVEITDTWELSAGGKVLTASRSIKTPQGDFLAKVVYNKK